MRALSWAVALTVLVPSLAAAQPREPLARARFLYNERHFALAILAADEAARNPDRQDSAHLIAARALLERYRETESVDDLTGARERLRRINPSKLATRERTELIVGFGETLFLEGTSGAAADVFESVLTRSDLSVQARERVLDWWATAVEREARPRPDIERQGLYQKIRSRMSDELASNAASTVAPYWIAAAARGQGDLIAAWDAAQAAWVRAPLTPDLGGTLREDVDRLVLRAIVPERAKVLGQPPDQIRADWERFKERWTR
jgi:hypothetical protein